MANKKCNRKNILINEIKHDWDELNISFKALIIIGMMLFLVVLIIAIFSDGDQGIKNSIAGVFRTTLVSVFGFLLSSNMKFNKSKNKKKIEDIKNELIKIENELDTINENTQESDQCELQSYYSDDDLNLVQIAIALSISIITMIVLTIILVNHNLENGQSISQLRDLMCSSIGFLIGESKKK